MLVDGPGEFVIQLPCANHHETCHECDNARYGDQEPFCVGPSVRVEVILLRQLEYCIFDLRHLYRTIEEQTSIVCDKSHDLNSVLQSQRIPHKHQFVDETEDIQGQEGRDRASVGIRIVRVSIEVDLKGREDVAKDSLERPGIWSSLAHLSNARMMAAWTMATSVKAHVHFDDGIYMLCFLGVT